MNESAKPTERGYHHGDLRRTLLDAAEQELAEKGIEGFSLRGCAKRAGVSHAAPAHHFRDVSGLLAALAAEGFARFVAVIAARQDECAEDDAPGRLVAAGLAYVGFARDNPALFRLMFGSDRPDFDDLALNEAATGAFGQLLDTVEAVRGRPPLESAAGRRDVAATWGVAHGLSGLIQTGRMKFITALPPQEQEAALTAVFRLVADAAARADD